MDKFTVILLISFACLFIYGFVKVVNAYTLPTKYCVNGDRDIEEISFSSHIPFQRIKDDKTKI